MDIITRILTSLQLGIVIKRKKEKGLNPMISSSGIFFMPLELLQNTEILAFNLRLIFSSEN